MHTMLVRGHAAHSAAVSVCSWDLLPQPCQLEDAAMCADELCIMQDGHR